MRDSLVCCDDQLWVRWGSQFCGREKRGGERIERREQAGKGERGAPNEPASGPIWRRRMRKLHVSTSNLTGRCPGTPVDEGGNAAPDGGDVDDETALGDGGALPTCTGGVLDDGGGDWGGWGGCGAGIDEDEDEPETWRMSVRTVLPSSDDPGASSNNATNKLPRRPRQHSLILTITGSSNILSCAAHMRPYLFIDAPVHKGRGKK
jgi:hypothetical protein